MNNMEILSRICEINKIIVNYIHWLGIGSAYWLQSIFMWKALTRFLKNRTITISLLIICLIPLTYDLLMLFFFLL